MFTNKLAVYPAFEKMLLILDWLIMVIGNLHVMNVFWFSVGFSWSEPALQLKLIKLTHLLVFEIYYEIQTDSTIFDSYFFLSD